MFQGLQESQLAGAIEAMLFVTDEPVGVITLADMLEVDPAQVEAALVELRDKLARGEDVSALLPAPVERYIRDKGLYGCRA